MHCSEFKCESQSKNEKGEPSIGFCSCQDPITNHYPGNITPGIKLGIMSGANNDRYVSREPD